MSKVAPVQRRLKNGQTVTIRTGVETDAAALRDCVLRYIENGEGQVVGNIDFHIIRRKRLEHTGEFGMSCLPEWRGNRLGTILLSELLSWAKSHPVIEKVTLRVIGSNARAQALYRKFGFQEEGRRKHEIKNPDGSYDDDMLMAIFV